VGCRCRGLVAVFRFQNTPVADWLHTKHPVWI
jgi:hypothetical protein